MDQPRSASRLLAFAKRLAADRRGATALEYGLIIALIVVVLIGGMSNVARLTVGIWTSTNTKVANAK